MGMGIARIADRNYNSQNWNSMKLSHGKHVMKKKERKMRNKKIIRKAMKKFLKGDKDSRKAMQEKANHLAREYYCNEK